MDFPSRLESPGEKLASAEPLQGDASRPTWCSGRGENRCIRAERREPRLASPSENLDSSREVERCAELKAETIGTQLRGD